MNSHVEKNGVTSQPYNILWQYIHVIRAGTLFYSICLACFMQLSSAFALLEKFLCLNTLPPVFPTYSVPDKLSDSHMAWVYIGVTRGVCALPALYGSYAHGLHIYCREISSTVENEHRQTGHCGQNHVSSTPQLVCDIQNLMYSSFVSWLLTMHDRLSRCEDFVDFTLFKYMYMMWIFLLLLYMCSEAVENREEWGSWRTWGTNL